MSESIQLKLSENKTTETNKTYYKSMIGSLTFLTVIARLDITFAVNKCAKYSENPRKEHFTAVNHIFSYLSKTSDKAILYQGKQPKELIAYSDADWAIDLDDRTSTTGYIMMMCKGAISWATRRQSSVALLSTESEYMAMTETAKQIIWLRKLLKDIGELRYIPTNLKATKSEESTKLNADNQGAIALANNPKHRGRNKHIQTKYHFIRQAVNEGVTKLEYIPTAQQLADFLTKPLGQTKHSNFTKLAGLTSDFRFIKNNNHQ
jgi:hypothetical protein